MAYAPPHNGVTPNPPYGHPEPAYQHQPQQDHAAYDHVYGYQSYENYRETTYDVTTYPLGRHHAPQDRPTTRGGEREYYGGTAQLGDMRQGNGYGGAAMPQPQPIVSYDERYEYQEPRARPPQSNHRPPPNVYKSPPINSYSQNVAQRGAYSLQAQQNGHRQEPARVDGSIQAEVGYHRNDQYDELHGDRAHDPQRSRIATSRSADAVRQPPQPVLQTQQQGHSNTYGSGAVLPGNGNHRSGSAPKSVSSRGQRQPTPPKPAAAQLPKPKERILGDLTSPDTISWDNPFPTFPTAKKKANQIKGESLDAAVTGMNLERDQIHDQRPSTANSKGSKSSSFSTEREPKMRPMQDYPDQWNQPKWDNYEGSNGAVHNEYNGLHSKPQPYDYQYNDAAYNSPKHQQNTREEWPISQNSQPPAMNGRRSEDANAVSSFRLPPSGSTSESQRSNTMSNNGAEAAPSLGPPSRHAEPAWQEPGPYAGYYGPSNKLYLPNSHAKTKPSQARPVNHPDPEAEIYSPIQDNPYEIPNSARPTPHGAQDSISDLFGSFYDTSCHDQGNHDQNKERQPPSEFDEDMPNFDAIPDSSNSHRRGMTIDEHLEHQHVAPAVPPMPVQYWGADPGYILSGPKSSGQVLRSRSSPNLKEPPSPRSPYHISFNFAMPGVVPAMPNKPLPRDFRDRPLKFNALPNSRQQAYGQQPRPQTDPRPGASASCSPGNAAGAYGSPPRTSQDRARNRQQRPQVVQNARSSTNKCRQSDNGEGQTSQPAVESRPASAPSNPDALPRHPAPVRPGLMPDLPVHQAPKLVLVRQYNTGTSALQQANPMQPPDPSVRASIDKRRISAPVTHEELERLRLIVASSPSDHKTQLILAKKMVEAASVLIDQRADQKTRAKTREKYILDAHKIVKKLVNNGYAEASFYLADCYTRGFLGLETDPKEAFNFYQSAAKAGHPQAAYRVAVCCEMGQEEGGGTRRDPLKAMQWYKRAATLGDTPAMYKMGIIQLKGLLGQPKNPNQAVNWLKRAADKADEENPHALHELGLLHEKDGGNDGVIKDELYSKQLFTQAAKLGYKFSQFRLGCAYEYGLMGCLVDPRQSIAWYSKAAVQEEHQSELALSGWYLTGSEGVLQQSDTEAYLWARKAAKAGLAKAEYAMGYFTEVGIGAPANLEDAKRWYWRAASQNFPKARDRLEDLRKGGAKMEKSRVSRSVVNKQTEGDCVVM